jgi:hypothetical protein
VTDARYLLHINRCGANWAGADRAHCDACHETWDSVELYDTHRRNGTCLPPHHLGLKPTKNGIWQHPTCWTSLKYTLTIGNWSGC